MRRALAVAASTPPGSAALDVPVGAVVLDPDGRELAAARNEREETLAAIREGLADIKAGRTKPARPALSRLAKKYGVATGD